jgi:spore coat protein A
MYAGLAGLYIIRDTLEQRLQLPCGKYEIPIMIQDKTFNKDGSLFYPSEPPFPVSVQPSVVPGFTGETIVVNGKVWPHLKVEPRKYRFRLLNASNSRAYTLTLSNNEVFYQIGTDGGLMEKPVELTSLNLLPAERADIIIDFSKFYHQNITLLNTADTNENTSQVLQFKVISPLKSKDNSKLPDFMYPMMHLEERLAVRNRILPLNVNTDMYGRPMFLLDNKMWHDPVTEKPELDTIEIWSIVNPGTFPHPVHLHLVQFQILERRPFDVVHYRETGEIIYTGPPVKPADNEMGWKDIVRVTPGEVTRIISQFKDFTGDYVWHCHILEHEDYDMMRPMKVIP